MNAFEGGSDVEGESQATQLLRNVLDTDANGSRKFNEPHGQSPRDDSTVPQDISDSLSHSRSPDSTRQYHYHGLAATQTQTQRYEGDLADQGSQKENINAPGGELRVTLPPTEPQPFPPQASSSKKAITKAPRVEESTHSHPYVTKPKTATNKGISPLPPSVGSAIPVSNINSGRHPSTRSTTYPATRTTALPLAIPEESSQDSFAGVLSQDPEQQFLAVSKQFDIPLSELAARSTNETPVGEHTSSMFASERRIRRAPSPPSGRVLVAATPSNSGGSQSPQSFDESRDLNLVNRRSDYRDNMVVDGDDDAKSQQSTSTQDSSVPSSSYRRFLNGERDPVLDAPAVELQATQPSTQPDTDASDGDTDPQTDSPWVTATASGNTARGNHDLQSASDPSSGPTHPRSLLSMVNPNKRWRYEKFQTAASDVQNAQRVHAWATSSVQESRDILSVETQPSLEDDESTRIPPRRLGFTGPANAKSADNHRYHQVHMDKDAMDIVPDSEPFRDDPDMVAKGKHKAAASPAERVSRRLSSGSDSHSGEIVIDSMDGGHADNDAVMKPPPFEEDDYEDDVPLAITTATRRNRVASRIREKAKTNTITHYTQIDEKKLPPQIHRKGDTVHAPAETNKGKQKQLSLDPQIPLPRTTVKDTRRSRTVPSITAKKVSGSGRSWETGVVPSSVPDQDIHESSNSGRSLRPTSYSTRRGRGGGAAAAPRSNVKKSSASSTVKHRRPRQDDVSDSSSDQLSEDQDELLIHGGKKEDDAKTENADDDYIEADHEAAGPSTRKRKRGGQVARSAPGRTGSKTSKLTAATPTTRQAKRLRSVASSSRKLDWDPTRVFALWKQDGHFYSGIVHSHHSGSRYLIQFDDGTQGYANIDQMRHCELRVGDNVLHSRNTRSSKVVDVAMVDQSGVVSISVDDDVEEVQIGDIRIAHKTISYAWKDRMVTSDSIITVVKPVKLKASPTPSKLSVTSTLSGRGSRRKILSKTGLVVTLSAGNENWEKDKESVMTAIKHSGGKVIDDWVSIIRMEGKHTHYNSRWVVEKNDIKWTGKDDIERVFLLADDANQKPKFLIALALGIPCLSVSWLHDSVNSGEEKEWLAYMLPQGYSDALGARPSQQVDVDWGNSVHQLNDIMANSVACKLFDKKSILCFGPEMVPQPKGKKLAGTDEKMQEANNAVARIILSMGAERVEAVSELKYASAPLSDFDFIVIKEAHQYVSELDEGTTVHWAWVKDCLIASRYLPLPEWEPMNSQDA